MIRAHPRDWAADTLTLHALGGIATGSTNAATLNHSLNERLFERRVKLAIINTRAASPPPRKLMLGDSLNVTLCGAPLSKVVMRPRAVRSVISFESSSAVRSPLAVSTADPGDLILHCFDNLTDLQLQLAGVESCERGQFHVCPLECLKPDAFTLNVWVPGPDCEREVA